MATRRGRRRTTVAWVVVTCVAALLAPAGHREAGAAPITGFTETTVISGLVNPTVVRFSPDGRIFVAEKSGIIKVFDGLGDPTATVFADLRTRVHNYWDRGLLGLALHPQFPTVPSVYVLYTHDAAIGGAAPRWGTAGATSDSCPTPPGPTADGCVVSGRLSRLQASGDTMTGSEQVLVEDWCQQYPSHSVGDLEFGADGSLYASGGDGASFTFNDYGQAGSPRNPCGDPPVPVGGTQTAPTAEGGALRSQDLRSAGDPVGLNGSVIRVDPMTGAGLPGNPMFASGDANARRIVATGLRNPFRLAVRPSTSELWVGDVGNAAWEEIDRIPDPADATLENFGWPCYEGDGRHGAFDSINLNICENLYAQSGAVSGPSFRYHHSSSVVSGDGCPTGSSSISGIDFYEGGPFPDSYDGALFFSDYSRDCIWSLTPGGTPQVLLSGAANPVDVEVGPGGDLFYVDFDGGTVRRISATNPQPPTASTYLSDLAWVTSTNGWGPVERDRSNGETLTADGQMLRLNGVTYPKGLGTHARSEIEYDLSGNCTRFRADVGIDDEVGSAGAVTFEVWGDGTRLFQSAVLTGASVTLPVDVAIAGVSRLRLVVDGGGDLSHDHADWGAARVECGSDNTAPTVTSRSPADGAGGVALDATVSATFSEPLDATTVDAEAFRVTAVGTTVPVAAAVTYDAGTRTARLDPAVPLAVGTVYEARLVNGTDGVRDLTGNSLAAAEVWTFTTGSSTSVSTYLSDVPWVSATNGWGPVELDRSNGENAPLDGGTITLDGVTYPKGLGAHARSEIVYDLPDDCSRFQADVGVDDEVAGGGSITFEVRADGSQLYRSPVLGAGSPTQHVDLPLGGAGQLTLIIDGGSDVTSDHGDWAGARVWCGGAQALDPEVFFTTPDPGDPWRVGDEISFSGGAIDGEGRAVPATDLSWTLLMHHCSSTCHTHTVQDFAAVDQGSFVAPDHEYPSYLELRLTADLPGGGTVSDSIELDPETVDLTFASDPTGLEVVAGATPGIAPMTRTVIVGSTVSVGAAATQSQGGATYSFAAWSDGGARSHDIVAPASPTTYTARYTVSGPMAFQAYNDLNGRLGDRNAARVTRFGYRAVDKTLIDVLTGQTPGARLSGSFSGGLDAKTNGGAQAVAGTDAARYFGTNGAPVVDLGRSIELDATSWSNVVTIDGLDPTQVYAVTLTANHGDSRFGNARFTRVTLGGAPSSTNASSSGVVVYSPTSVSFNTGYNTQRGYVARWVGVSPGADGRISITSQWDRSRGGGSYNSRGYAMTALLLEH